MPIFSAIISGIGAIVSGIGSFIAGAGFIGKALINIGLNVAGSLLMRALAGDQAGPRGIQYDATFGENQPRGVLCGRRGTGGHRIHDNAYGPSNKFLQQVYALYDFPIGGVTRLWLNGEIAVLGEEQGAKGRVVTTGDWAGKVWVKVHDGWQTAADPGLVANANPPESWDATAIGAGCAYAVLTFEYDREKLGSPLTPFFEVEGAPLYDWRKDSTVGGVGSHRWGDVSTWEFSENPVLMAYAYARGFSWNGDVFMGMGIEPENLPIDRWTAAANICDEIANGAPRYRASIEFVDNEHKANMEQVMLACAGLLATGVDGMWPIIGTAQPVVATLTADDLMPDADFEFARYRPRDTLVNSVSGAFPDPDSQWSPRPYKTAGGAVLAALDRRTRDVALDYPVVPYADQAARLANIVLQENRYQASARITVRPRWQVLEPWDWIRWDPDGQGEITWAVTDITVQSLDSSEPRVVTLALQEVASAIWTTGAPVAPPLVPAVPGEPVRQGELLDFIALPVTVSGDGGLVAPGIRASWSAPTDPDISAIVLEWRLAASPGDVFTRTVTADRTVALLTDGVVSRSEYEVRHRLIADPPRPFAPSAWVSVVTPDTPANDVSVGLGQVREDVSAILAQVMAQYDLLIDRTEASAGDAAIDAATEYLARKVIEKRVGNALARIIREEQVRADADGALAQSIQAVEASIGEGLAGGLIAIRANTTPSGGAAAQIDFIVKAGENGVETVTAMSLRAYSNGDSDILMSAGRLVVTDDNNNEVSPLVFENGQLVADIARFKAAVAEKFTTPNGKVTFGTLAVGVEGLEIKT